MRRLLFAVSIVVFTGCAVGSASSTDDFSVDGTVPAVDAGPDTSVSYTKPGSGPASGDDTEQLDAGNGADAKKDTGTPTNSGCAFSGTLVAFDLSSLSGTTSTVNASSTATGITATALTRSSGLMAVSTSGAYNSTGWPTGALDPSKYLSFTFTAPAGCAVTASSIAVIADASGSGPASASLATSTDAYAAKKSVTVAGSTTNASVNAEVTAGSTLEVRVYGYGSGSASGTMRMSNSITVTGSIH